MNARRIAVTCACALAALGAVPVLADLGFAPAVQYPAGPAPRLVATHDVTGDGALDVVVLSGSIARVRVLVNDGHGHLGAPVITSLATMPHDWAFADFDGDGRMDLATISGFAVSTLDVLRADGAGHFIADGGFVIQNFSNGQDELAAADVNEDGLGDLLVADNGTLRIFLGNGDGSFVPHAPFVLGIYFGDPLIVDANGDGHTDLLLRELGFGFDWVVLLGDGSGGFTKIPGGDGPCDSINYDAVVGDLNGDHRSDFAAGFYDYCAINPSTNLMIGLSNGVSITGQYPGDAVLATGTRLLSIADVDGDGFGDIVGSIDNAGLKSVFVSRGHGDGTFEPAVQVPAGAAPKAIATGDLDGDGVPDVVAGNYWTDSVTVLLNTSLPPGWSEAGGGLAGAAGVPALAGSGELVAGGAVQISLSGGAPGAAAALIIGLSKASLAFKGGVMVPSLDVLVPGLALSPAGALVFAGTWPAGIAGGVTTWWQMWIADAGGPKGYAASNALAAKAQAP